MENWAGIERRRYPRRAVTVDCIIFEIDKIPLPFRFDQEVIRDVSAGGVCFEVAQPILTTSEVSMEFGLFQELPFINAKGAVVWAKKKENDSPQNVYKFRMGLCFTEISKEDKEHINNFVAHK